MTKKWIALLAAVGMLTAVLPSGYIPERSVHAEDEVSDDENQVKSIGGVTYRLYDDHAEVIEAVPKVKIEVLDTIDGLPVTSVAEEAFANRAIIQEIILPDSITSIGYRAFGTTPHLKRIVLPSGLTSLPERAFDGCEALEEIVIPETVTEIGDECFRSCKVLSEIAIPDAVQTIGDSAFEGCWELQEIQLPEGLVSIGASAFQNCYALKSITIPDSVTSLGMSAFESCNALETVNGKGNFTSLGKNTFLGTAWFEAQEDGIVYLGTAAIAYKGLFIVGTVDTSIEIAEGTTILADYLLYHKSVENITLPDSLLYIGTSALRGTKLTEIQLPPHLKGLNSWAIADISITDLSIPSEVETLESGFASGCKKLKTITVSPENPNFKTYDGILYDITLTDIICVPRAVTECRIPETVRIIPSAAFSYCIELQHIVLPETLEEIGINAFTSCYALECITIPSSVRTIETDAFAGCTALSDLTIQYGVEHIGYGAFEGCTNLHDVHLPNSITNFENAVFYRSGLENLVLSNQITNLESEIVEIWFDYYDELYAAPSEDSEDVEWAPTNPVEEYISPVNCTSLKTITFSNAMQSIADYVFDESLSVTDVYFYGSETEWENIEMDLSKNPGLSMATVHFSEGTEGNGDVNWDGEVTVLDCVKLQWYLIHGGDLTNVLAADLNQDGVINGVDLALLKRQVLNA